MECTIKYIELLLSGQINELDSIAGYTDRKVRILRLLRMLHSINKLLLAEDVDIQMMSALIEVTVENIYELVLSLFLIVAKRIRSHGLGV